MQEEKSRVFGILDLGKYEQQHFVSADFADGRRLKDDKEKNIFVFVAPVLRLTAPMSRAVF